MQTATVKMTGPDFKKLDSVCQQIKDICQKTGAKVSGPVPLPTKKLKLLTKPQRAWTLYPTQNMLHWQKVMLMQTCPLLQFEMWKH
jgi:hypothetical protein